MVVVEEGVKAWIPEGEAVEVRYNWVTVHYMPMGVPTPEGRAWSTLPDGSLFRDPIMAPTEKVPGGFIQHIGIRYITPSTTMEDVDLRWYYEEGWKRIPSDTVKVAVHLGKGGAWVRVYLGKPGGHGQAGAVRWLGRFKVTTKRR